jgi:hypothetical protein
MSDTKPICPDCLSDLSRAVGALCPKCGAKIASESQMQPLSAKQPWKPSVLSRSLFWLLLVLPAFMVLASSSLAKSEKNAATNIWFMTIPVGALGAIYCGIWLARRFTTNTTACVFAALVSIFLLGVLNLAVTFVGCITSF